MNQMSPVNVSVNGRNYAWPRVTAIAICLDGCEPAYLDEAIKAGLMPALVKIKEKGTVRMAHSVIPSFTNPNNMSIATGRPPSVHGICGNYLYERETGKEVMMNDPRFLRAPTIFKAYYDAGARVAVVTARISCVPCLAMVWRSMRIAQSASRQKSLTNQPRRSTVSTTRRHGWADLSRRSIRRNCRSLCLRPV
jgi:phosphonoacetate hydrolase